MAGQIKLEDFCKTGSGTTPSRSKMELYYNGTIPWVKSGELREGVIFSTEEHVTEAALNDTSLRFVPKGALLVALYGATIGRIAQLGIEATTNQAVCHVIPDSKKCFDRYLFHALINCVPYWLSLSAGGAQPNISQKIIKETEIPLPPLSEQRRLAAILDEADAIRKARTESLRLLDELVKSTFLDMFGDPNKNIHDFPVGTIRDLASEVKYGSSQKAGDSGQWPILRMNNITYDGNWDFSDLKYVDLSEQDVPKYTVSQGDILFNRTNSKELVGKTAVFPAHRQPMAFAGYLVRLRTNQKAIPEYVGSFLNSSYGKSILRHMCKSIIGMANINAQELQNIMILIPPLPLQQKFANYVAEVGCQREATQTSLAESETLFASLSQRAFRGEL